MQALGNDFMVLDSIRQKVRLTSEIIRQWSDRRLGVGFDQLLLIEAHQTDNADFKYRIFNTDGSEVEQCGNGARCVARFIFDSGLSKKKVLKLKTSNGLVTTKLLRRDWIKASLAIPEFDVSIIANTALGGIGRNDEPINFSLVSVGNPHAVILVSDIANADVTQIGPFLEKNPIFPKGINVEFMEIVSRDKIKLRVWERGVGETPACGSGACAAVVIGQQQRLLDANVTVQLPGGKLEVEWQGADTPVYLMGPAIWVYDGLINWIE